MFGKAVIVLYEMKGKWLSSYTIPTDQQCPQSSNSPDSAFIFTTQAIVFDHLEKQMWLAGFVRLEDQNHTRVDYVSSELGMHPGLSYSDYLLWTMSIEKQLRKFDNFMSSPKQTLLKENNQDEKVSSSVQTPFTPDVKPDAYMKSIEEARSYIHEGQSYELCLTTQFKTILSKRLDDNWVGLYQHIRSFNPAPFSALLYFHFPTKDICILSSSPEKFLQIDNEGVMEMK